MKMSMELLRVPGLDGGKELREVRMASREKATRNLHTQRQTMQTAERSAVTLAVRS